MTEHTIADEPYPLNPMYASACQFGMRGLRLLPVEHHTRTAILPQWPINASNEVPFIDKHFASGHNNIGLCCGPQPQGWNILCVDVDNQETWKALEAEHGPIDRTSLCFHRTPSGGLHLFFDVPANMAVTGTDVFGDGIDARGGHAGNVGCGYVLLPPSVAPSKESGELLPYGVSPGKGLLDRPPGPAPKWLLEMINAHLNPPQREIQASINRHPSGLPFASDDPWTYVREHFSWEEYLLKHGWQPSGGQYWTRPGKSVRDGHSAQLHDDGRLAIWTGEIPNEIRDLGTRQVDGGVSISLADFITAYEFGGDRAAFGRHVRTQLMPPPPRRAMPTTEAPAERTEALNLPAEFWLARPWLTHVRDAAWAMGSTPDGQLMAMLSHLATSIPPQMFIPAIVRDLATFDLLTVIVGPSGSGKSSLLRRANRIAPSPRTDLRFGLGLSSGEGLLEAYYGLKPVEQADGKMKTERTRVFTGVSVTLDEGALLTTLAGRQGFTGIDHLLTAWSGGTLSTPNATQDRFRHVEAGTYRFTATLGIQVDLADGLWAGTRTAQGFTGRLLFGRAVGGDVPAPGRRPVDPGELDMPVLPSVDKPFEYPAEVWAEVQTNDHAKQLPGYVDDPLNAHHDLLRLKVAGIMAAVEGRTSVSLSDWVLATQVVDTSVAVRTWLQTQARRRRSAGDVEADVYKGVRAARVANAERDVQVSRVARLLVKHITKSGVLISELRQRLASRDRRYFDEAMDSLVTAGLVTVDDLRAHL